MTYWKIFLLTMTASAVIASGVSTALRMEPQREKKKLAVRDAIVALLGHHLGIAIEALIIWLVLK